MLGTGIIKGLLVTAKNLVGSYHDPKRLPTIEYPEKRYKLPENFRSFPFLVYDGDGERRPALRRLPHLREGMPAAVHLHRPRARRKGRVQETQDLRHRLLRLRAARSASRPAFDSIKMDHH
ncbi:hypothetical protein OH491_06790 [Termitidicoccus mucosus]|uniref:hypothetical protein n=1 Tax=Termitidicoccus mucosus TaxID=1184151 RepID=UPI0031832587